MTDFSGASGAPAPDLHTQFEDLLGLVHRCENWARIEDRIDLAIRIRRDVPDDLRRAEG